VAHAEGARVAARTIARCGLCADHRFAGLWRHVRHPIAPKVGLSGDSAEAAFEPSGQRHYQVFELPVRTKRPNMKNRTKRGLAGFGFVVLACLIGMLVWSRLPSPSQLLPQPNGYDDFVEAASRRLGFPPDAKTASTEELRQFVDRNRPVFDLVRTGLRRECRVDLNKSTNYLIGTSFTVIAQKFLVEGELALREAHQDDAIRTYIDLVRFGHESARGGLVIDRLRGLAYEKMGLGSIKELAGKLEARPRQGVVQTLQEIEERAEVLDDLLRRDRRWTRQNAGLRGRIWLVLNWNKVRQTEQKVVQSFKDMQNTRRQLMIDLAAGAYELNTGKRPVAVSELVPKYLKAVPVDAHTGVAIDLTKVK